MNGENKIKYWNVEEENKLINEINNLTDIDEILKNHDRKLTGIIMRIEKIMNNPEQSKKITNQTNVIMKYLNSKPKNMIDYDKMYSEILKYKSLEAMANDYKISIPKIKSILEKFLEKKDNDMTTKLRIRSLLNTADTFDFAEKVYEKKLSGNTGNT